MCLGSNAPFNQRFTVVGDTLVIMAKATWSKLRSSIAAVNRMEKSELLKKKKKKTHHAPFARRVLP